MHPANIKTTTPRFVNDGEVGIISYNIPVNSVGLLNIIEFRKTERMKKYCLLILLINIITNLYAGYPTSYYCTITGKSGAQLKTALHDIICQDTTHYLKYGSGVNHTWQGFYSTDRDITNNSVVDMYSNSIRYFAANYMEMGYPGFGQTIHIEHSVPKSWWKCDIDHPDCAAEDLNHLYPADGSTNSSKGDNPLGVVMGKPTKNNGVSKIGPATYNGYTGNVFEPADQYKGDFARSYFYMATAFEHYADKWDTTKPENMMEANTYPTLKPWAVSLLLQWNRQDPVSPKELTRVEKVYSIQNNRNPFIDYPELAEYIWGDKIGLNWGITATIIQENVSTIKIVLNHASNSIQLLSDENLPVNIYIYSVDGKLILQQSTSSNTYLTVPQMQRGIYIVKLTSNYQVVTQKIIL